MYPVASAAGEKNPSRAFGVGLARKFAEELPHGLGGNERQHLEAWR